MVALVSPSLNGSATRRVHSARPLSVGYSFGAIAHTLAWRTSRVRDNVWHHAMNSPAGALAFALQVDPTDASATLNAWGPGREWIVDRLDALIGAHDTTEFTARDTLLANLEHRLQGLRIVQLGSAYDFGIATIVGQRVTTVEARESWREFVRRYGEPAPGPLDLRLPPASDVVAQLPAWAWRRLGVEGQRADTMQRFAREVNRIEHAAAASTEALRSRLVSVRGIGPWTRGYLEHFVTGNADAVPIGDWHFPRHVAFALAGERIATDERMLELLEPFRPQRGRAWRLIVAGTSGPPRRVPRARVLGLLRAESAAAKSRRRG